MKKILLSICGVLYSLITFSQQYNGKQAEVIYYDAEQLRYDNRSHAPLFIQLKKTAFISQGQAIKALGNVLKIQAADRLELVRSEQDAMGVNHLRYQQYYQNIKVISGEYILHEKQKRIVAANGIFYDNLKLNIVPTIEASVALQFALNAINAQLYEWEVTTEETIKNSNGESISIITFPKGELVVLPALNGLNIQSPTLCWKFVVCAREPMARYNVYVDANNGEVVWKENLICTIAATGNGTTIYSGSQTFITENVAAYNYRLHDATRGFGVNTFNMLTGTDNSFAIDFTDSDNVWTSAQNQDNAALDAHWGAEKTYDYYLTKHARNSFDNAGATINAYVHYGSGYNNAFWNGLSVNFGDGDGTQFSPLTELTIVAHELTHGYTQQSSGLFFINESGALNESFSDILGKSIDFWVNPITADWKIGGNCFTPAIAGDALRYMDNPNACGNPDTYLGSYWHSSADDNGGVHTNCGVQNFWFYLLVNGGVGSNDNGFEYNVTGIGIESAAQIAYRCNTVYLTSSSQYADAAFYSLQSANDLFGACSPEAVAVKNAWDAVGVMGLQFNTSASLSATSSNCAGGNIQLNASGGLNYSWNGPENFSSTLQNPIINNAQLSAAGIYYCVITNGICSDSLPIQIALNPSPSITTTATTAICKGDDVQLNATALAGGWGSNIGSNNSEVPIPDYPLLGATSAITISGATSAALITSVTIDSLLHTWDGDLDIKLIAPNGSQITLVSGVGSSGHDFIHTVFSSSAIGDITLGAAPFTGSFYPQQSFSLLSGYGNGSWKLKITDRSGQDVGTLYSWSITLAPDSISSFSWSPLSGLGNASVSDIIVSPITTSVYTVTVNDAIGCAATATTTVMVSDIDVTTAGTTNVSCNGGINGAIDISVAGGLGNYNYSWSNSTVSEDQSMLTFGIYSITVTDSINCIANHTITITEPPLLATSIITSEAHCGNNDGVATAQATGGIGSYTYLWNTGSTVSLINNLAPGIYSVTVTDGNNCSEVIADTVTNTNAVSPMPDPIIGNAWACRNQNNVHYSVPLVPGAISYNWSAPAGTTFTTNNNEINLDFGSTYTTQDLCVSVTTQCGVSQQTCMGISFLVSRPATPGAIVASADACANTIVTYSIGSVQRATTINWTAPANATIISGQGTKIVQVQFNGSFTAGSLSVYASNCIGVSANRVQYLQAIPNTPGNIMGATTNLCAQTGVVYSIAPSNSGATFYTWTMPANVTIINGQGTNSVIASFINAPETGLVCVNATNSCGNSAAKCLPVTVLATRPSSIIGDPWACRNQTNVHYSIPLVAGAISYNWNAPVGSTFSANNNEITLNFDSAYTTHRLCVSITNACGENQEKCMDVALIVSKPNTPSAIIGSVVACANTTVTYSINSVLRATNYKWTAPTNASIVSGQGSKTVQIAFNNLFTSGNLFVNASNCKGVSPNRLLNVQATPATPGSITGITTNLCGANGVAYSIAPSLTGSTSYTWTVPASATILYGQGSSSITASFASAPFNGNVCVTASNSCGTSTAKCLPTTLYPARPVSIIGPASICANQSAVNFNVMAEPGITYNWMMPQGATVTSGQGSNAVTVNWGNTSGIIKVGAYNACGSQLARSKFVTINCRMEEELNDQVIQLYPNPARDNVELNLVGATLPCTVFLTDLIGKNLLVNTFYKAQSAIDLSALPVGLYFVRIKNEQINKTIRLVKE